METPLPIYVALKVYAATEHCEKTINQLHELGMCICYARVRDISKVMANSVVRMFEAEGAPCGPALRHGLLTIGSADNFDLNPSNRDAKDALQGTGCVITQLPTSTTSGTVRSAEPNHKADLALSSIAQLPRFYTNIKEVEVSTGGVLVPAVTGSCRPTVPPQTCDSAPQTATDPLSIGNATFSNSVEEHWVTHAQSILDKDYYSSDDTIS